MLYYLAELLRPQFSVLNVLTYHTVRAGAAAFTAFIISLLIGPSLIRRLRRLKVGQYIRQEHVEDLHALHKGKAGTPTMGGALMISATLITLVLWARWSNRLLWVAVGMLCLLGIVGFLDDYIKLRRKHNRGLSARTKFIGQILVGLALGIYLVTNPITLGPTHIAPDEVRDWTALSRALHDQGMGSAPTPGKQVWDALPDQVRGTLATLAAGGDVARDDKAAVIEAINKVFETKTLHDGTYELPREAQRLMAEDPRIVGGRAVLRLNRLLFESAVPGALAPSTIQTQVEIPGLKEVLIPLGMFYILFVMVTIVASSNAVNLTDGLDGLAIGASIMSLLAYTAIAYIVSRADWSQYLFLIYVPEASELTVFGAALLGAGMGFLWFNSHPAEVFMGDTGSLALGGAIGTMAILTKQELLLLVIGGLFVVEAASVIIQVVSFKLRGKRVFKMAPLHHHFELVGWSETKVTTRFWIISLLFALMGLAALKLR